MTRRAIVAIGTLLDASAIQANIPVWAGVIFVTIRGRIASTVPADVSFWARVSSVTTDEADKYAVVDWGADVSRRAGVRGIRCHRYKVR